MKITYIYSLRDPETGEIRYIGKANNLKKRYFGHLNNSKKEKNHRSNWINSLRSKKLKPIIEIIDEVPSEDWIFWEQYWICQLKIWGFNLLNYTLGGDGSTFGNKTSFKKGQGSIPVLQINSDGEIVKEFESSLNVKKELGIKICHCIDKNRLTSGGYFWIRKKTFENMSKDEFSEFIIKNKKPRNKGNFKKGLIPWNKNLKGSYNLGGKKTLKEVLQYDLNNNLLCSFVSYMEASKSINCSSGTIRKACSSTNGKSMGFIWRYK